MTTKARININVDLELKEEAVHILNDMGLDMTSALTIYLKKIVKTRSIPFELTSPRLFSVEEVAGKDWQEGLDEIEDGWE
jgi:DNA-damage-inducible protein J